MRVQPIWKILQARQVDDLFRTSLVPLSANCAIGAFPNGLVSVGYERVELIDLAAGSIPPGMAALRALRNH